MSVDVEPKISRDALAELRREMLETAAISLRDAAAAIEALLDKDV